MSALIFIKGRIYHMYSNTRWYCIQQSQLFDHKRYSMGRYRTHGVERRFCEVCEHMQKPCSYLSYCDTSLTRNPPLMTWHITRRSLRQGRPPRNKKISMSRYETCTQSRRHLKRVKRQPTSLHLASVWPSHAHLLLTARFLLLNNTVKLKHNSQVHDMV